MTLPIIKDQHYNSLTCSDKVLVLEYILRRLAESHMGDDQKWVELTINSWVNKYGKDLYKDFSGTRAETA